MIALSNYLLLIGDKLDFGSADGQQENMNTFGNNQENQNNFHEQGQQNNFLGQGNQDRYSHPHSIHHPEQHSHAVHHVQNSQYTPNVQNYASNIDNYIDDTPSLENSDWAVSHFHVVSDPIRPVVLMPPPQITMPKVQVNPAVLKETIYKFLTPEMVELRNLVPLMANMPHLAASMQNMQNMQHVSNMQNMQNVNNMQMMQQMSNMKNSKDSQTTTEAPSQGGNSEVSQAIKSAINNVVGRLGGTVAGPAQVSMYPSRRRKRSIFSPLYN